MDHPRASTPMLRVIAGADELYTHECPGLTAMLRFDSATGMVYESGSRGLGIIDPGSGDRVHYVAFAPLLDPSLPEVSDGFIYVLGNERRSPTDGQSRPGVRRNGLVAALRHP